MESQEKQLHKLFKSGIRLTCMKAMLYHGIGNLKARVERMRNRMGLDVKDNWIKTANGKRIKQYYMN